jgi:hypothetical protein
LRSRFGQSDWPSPDAFAYTFDHVAEVVAATTERLGLERYSLFVQDYGGPVGMRLARANPDLLQALIVQNAVSHEAGLGPLWEKRRAFWRDRAAHEAALGAICCRSRRRVCGTSAARHIRSGTIPICGSTNTASSRPPASCEFKPSCFMTTAPTLQRTRSGSAFCVNGSLRCWWCGAATIPRSTPPGAPAYRDDVPDAEIHILDAGHFALDEATDEIAALTADFLTRRAHGSPALAFDARWIAYSIAARSYVPRRREFEKARQRNEQSGLRDSRETMRTRSV